MSPEDHPDDAVFTELLARYSEALAAGQDFDPAQDPVVPPHLLPRLRRALDGLHRLRRARRRPKDVPTLPPAENDATIAPPADATLDGAGFFPVGRFRPLRRLGDGGGGIVFLAFDPELRREVALKVPQLATLLTPEKRRRFLREAQAAAVLNHPNLVPVHEAGEAGGVCFIVSKYCPGGNLAEWLARQSAPVPARLAAELATALAAGLHHAHERGILHRDVKPGNVLLDLAVTSWGRHSCLPGGGRQDCPPHDAMPFTPRLADFGLAKMHDGETTATRSGSVLGTPPYMAPEQAEGRLRDIGPPTDVYGLGAVLYELLAGRPPFRGETDAATLRQVLADEPTPLRRLRRDLPRDLETICLKCLEKEPGRRYPTAAALGDDLRRFLANDPIQARPCGTVERLRKWLRRRPVRAVLLGGALVLGLTLLSGGLWLDARRRMQDETAAKASRNLAEQEAEVRRAREQLREERQRLRAEQRERER